MEVEGFLAGLRVLAVDDDRVCLKILEMQLRHCKYNVTAVANAETALGMLRAGKDGEQFDLVISDVHMPKMDGFRLLELVGLEMDIPVIMLSANEEMQTIMKGIKHGACDYLLKPVHLGRLKNIWLHVVKKSGTNDPRNHVSDAEPQEHQPMGDDKDGAGGATKYSSSSRKNKKVDADGGPGGGGENAQSSSAQKKQRVHWSGPLHSKFVEVVNHIGIDRVVPKKVWEMMNVDGLTREQVASHLQKFRQGLRKLSLVRQKQSNTTLPAETECWRQDWNYINTNGMDSSPSALGMHSHQPVQPMSMSSQRNLAIPLIGPPPAGNPGGNLQLNGAPPQDVVELTSAGNSYGNAPNGGGLYFSSSSGSSNAHNCIAALGAGGSLPYAISGNPFANVSIGTTQPLAAGLCNSSSSWNAELPSMFPSHGLPQEIDQFSRLAISSGPMTTIGNEFEKRMTAFVRTSAPVVGLSEQLTMFNLGSGSNSTSVPMDSSAPLVSAPNISYALPYVQRDDGSGMQAEMLNVGGASGGNLPLENGSVDQQPVGDLMEISEAQHHKSGDLDGFVAFLLN